MPHSPDDTTDSPKGMNMVPNFNPSLYLLNEFMTGQDLDGNGLVYGTDFGIEKQGKPEMLKAVEQNPAFRQPRTKISYDYY